MNVNDLIEQGNQHRANREPELALKCYAQAFVENPEHQSAWNNYGNVLREIGYPRRSIPFLEHCLRLNPTHSTASFNLAVSCLLSGDYSNGWKHYESRWNYEHLQGQLPVLPNRWNGESLKDKTILVIGEQGLGDNIQFVRFCSHLKSAGANIVLQIPESMISLLSTGSVIDQTISWNDTIPKHHYWTPMMSIPRIFDITLDNLHSPLNYIVANEELVQIWNQRLGLKKKLRIGFCWSGRRDTWINQHKAVPFDQVVAMIKRNTQHEWVNLQIDSTNEESQILESMGVRMFPGTIQNLADTAALITAMDVVVGVDTAVSHLSGSLGRPTWIMLNKYAVDWRWLLDRNDSPWYPSVRLFRQESMDDWDSSISKIERHLKLFKI